MKKHDSAYETYVQILREELVPAMGCTEPIAIAYCAAKAKEVLGMVPDSVDIYVSGNIIKNVKSVIVPNTGGLKGIEAAAAAGIIGGDAGRELEVISQVTEQQKREIQEFLKRAEFKVEPTYGEEVLEIIVTLRKDGNSAKVRICKAHANIVLIEKNGETVFSADDVQQEETAAADRSALSVREIVEFANMVDIADVKEILDRQIEYNSAISNEGLKNKWGANIGKILIDNGADVKTRAKAAAAAGSDARMSGCELPVVIVSGSGNQGITASMPVIEYGAELGVERDELYRALCVSNLIAVHLKAPIGKLSAYCGAVCAGCGAGAGIAYMKGGDHEVIGQTVINAIAILSGMVCDGAKPSCAGKIAASVDAGILGYDMCLEGQSFKGGDGILGEGVEETIANVGRLGRLGMAETDHEILRIMTQQVK